MHSYREEARSESAGHRLRTQELARRLGARLSLPASSLLVSSREFDRAAEFAALEGRSIGQAIREFVSERPGLPFSELCRPAPELKGGRLPVVPRAVARLLRTNVENVSTVELERIAASDPVLAGRVLGAANSARFGSQFRITGLRDAVMRVGIPETRRILVSACVDGLFASKSLQDLWKHSQEVAVAAGKVAVLAGIDNELAWVAGLLHDVGRAALAMSPREIRDAQMGWLAAGFPLVYAETLAQGRDHAETGAALLRQWELPAEIVEAVSLHHRPECSDIRLTAVLCLAEDLVATKSGVAAEDLWSPLRRAIACERAGIVPDDFDALGGVLKSSVCA